MGDEVNAKPNVIVISTHDTGCHFGCYGVPTVETPNIDRLAAEGVKFDNMFATCCICSPSRGSLQTGRYPQSNGLVGLAGKNWKCEFNDPRQHLSHIMRDNGYHTVFFGHQHETEDISSLGFCDTSGAHEFLSVAHGQVCNKGENDKEGALGYHCLDAPTTAKYGADFIRQYAREPGSKPFHMQMGFFETHTPYIWGDCTPDDSKGRYLPDYTQSTLDSEWLERNMGSHIANLQGSVRMVDEAVGIVLDELENSGLVDNTLVVFTVDHGPELPRAKWTMYDAGLRVAFIMRWLGGDLAGGRSVSGMLSNVDFVPTLRDITGISIPDNVEGESFASLLAAGCEEGESPREEVFALFVYMGMYCARTNEHKLIRHFTDDGDSAELYDLKSDPLELEDVSEKADYAEVLQEMNERMRRWLVQVGDDNSRRMG